MYTPIKVPVLPTPALQWTRMGWGSVAWLMADGPDCLHHVQHDLGVLGGGEVSPLLGLKMTHPANLSSTFTQLEGPANQILLI